MDRVFESNAAGTPPSAPVAPSTGYPTNGDPQQAIPASKPGEYWFYMITEEIRRVITDAGLTPDHTDVTQLSSAIIALIAGAVPTLSDERVFASGVTFGPSVVDGNAVYWDTGNSRFDQALADGTTKQKAVGFADVTNSEVTFHGQLPGDLAGLTPGATYYLSASTPGAITATAPSANVVKMGVAKNTTDIFVDVDGIASDYVSFGLHTIGLPARGMDARTTNGATPGVIELAANAVMLNTLDFDPVTTQYANFEIAGMPASWDGGALYFIPIWSHASGATAYGVTWKLRLRSLGDGEALDQAYGTAQASTDAGGTADYRYAGPLSAAITPAGTPVGGEALRGEIYRDTADGNDTLDIAARLHGAVLLYTVNAAHD